MDELTQQTTEVLVIGAGPIGLFAAFLLGKLGIPTLVIEKYKARRGQPKAHALNPRTLEIFRQCGLDTQKLRSMGADPHGVDRVRFMDRFAGWEFGSLPYERQFEDVLNVTSEPLFNVAQPLVEDFLAEYLQRMDRVAVKSPVTWLEATEDQFGNIISTVLDRESGNRSQISSRFLIACDGARAISRQQLGIPFQLLHDKATEKHYVTVHFKADLSNFRTGILFFLMQPYGLVTFICYDRKKDWVFVFRYNPEETPASHFTPDECYRRVQDALGSTEVSLKLLSTTIWSTTPRLADKYRSGRIPNAFLAGDAAHTFSPTGGLGVNTGFGDVHNLVWKIHAVREGRAPSTLLDSYGMERRPVAQANAAQSTVNEENIAHLGRLVASHGRETWATAEFRGEIEAAIANNADHFDSLDLQLGANYAGQQRDPGKDVSAFIPCCTPGYRLPHAWVDRKGERISCLDLIVVGLAWTVLSPSAEASRRVTAGLDPRFSSMVLVQEMGVDFGSADQDWISMVFPRDEAVLVRPDQHVAARVSSPRGLEQALATGLRDGMPQ
ncbi:FAD binding domain-containing protein [Aspergillus pseudoustus]|uniref:FAD binding domain-containing protein n=1 Tax=Aspergillus pseudoustus TaxID=1810923 RepID=A0ABR4IZG0_9EURO